MKMRYNVRPVGKAYRIKDTDTGEFVTDAIMDIFEARRLRRYWEAKGKVFMFNLFQTWIDQLHKPSPYYIPMVKYLELKSEFVDLQIHAHRMQIELDQTIEEERELLEKVAGLEQQVAKLQEELKYYESDYNPDDDMDLEDESPWEDDVVEPVEETPIEYPWADL